MNKIWINSHVSKPQDLPLGQFYDLLVTVEFPIITAAVYLIVVSLWSQLVRSRNKKSEKNPKKETGSTGLKVFVVLHNLLLMVFSLLSFYHTFYILSQQFKSNQDLSVKFCDKNQVAWNSGLFYWSWLFYLSKYYEMVDTAIILIKGRTPSLLQSYHHAGAIIGMWILVAYHTPGAWIFVTLNSFIHTIMYSYYIMSTLGYRLPGKRYITYMQITQFFVGIFIALFYIFLPGCQTPGQNGSILFNIGYVTPLIFLFYAFARKNYAKPVTKRQ